MRKTYNIFKKLGRRNLALSIVALVLTSIMLVGATYSWIENITAVQITNMPQDGTGSNTSKLKFASDINKTIELGNCGPDSKDGKLSKFNAVNLGTYFNESGGMHLTTCSGDGESFYFKTLKGSAGARKYRIGTEDDENVHYISATFMVCSPEADVDMWFNEVPSVSCGGNANTNSIACYSITVDGETNVYSSSGAEYAHIHDADGTTEQVAVRKTSKYTFGNTQNVDADGKANGNVLFRVGEKPKKVTVKIWLQYTEDNEIYTDLKPDINMVLASTWAKTRRITVSDCTSDGNTEYWMTSSDSPKLYVALASDPDKYHWELTINKDSKKGTVDIPSYYYTGDEIYVFRIPAANNWGDDSYDGVIKVNVNGHQVPCWNYWKTTLPKGFDDLVYNIVGNTPVIYDGHKKQNDTGYSFWGEAERITVTDTIGLNYYKNIVRMIVHDINANYYYPLYPHDDHTWTGHIPRTSDKIEFLYRKDGFPNNAINSINSTNNDKNCYKNETPDYRWGYKSTDTPPQTRPYDDKTYTILSTTEGTWKDYYKTEYRLAGFFNGSNTWDTNLAFYKEKETDDLAFASITLNKDTLNQIKVLDTSNNHYYSNTDVMCRSASTNFEMTYDDKIPNMGFISDAYDGTYKFWLNTTTMKLSVTYPGSGGASRVYLVTNYNGYDKYAYMWKTENDSTTDNGDHPGQKMSHFGKIGDRDIFWLSYKDGVFPNKVKFSGRDGSTEKWASGDNDFTGYQLYYIIG